MEVEEEEEEEEEQQVEAGAKENQMRWEKEPTIRSISLDKMTVECKR